jgi:CubicO group peptidase (beta-lactamase class C family)
VKAPVVHRTASRGLVAITLALAIPAAAAAQGESANPKVDSIFAAFDKRDSPGCAVAVVDAGKTVFAKGYGMASLEHDLPITPSSAFYAASVSKQFTAFAVAMLAQQGKLSLDDDIRKWIPEVPNFGKTITVRNLIHHTSGLRDYFGLLGMTGWPSDGPLTEARFLDLVGRQKALNFDPGARHLYSNTGYVLLSILVKRVSGQSLREFSDQAIFGPLGMSNSHFRDDHATLVKNRALAYSPRAGGWELNMPGFDVVGDGGLFTTVEDMAKWARNFDDHTVGGDAVAAQVLTRGRLTSGDSIPYAFGLSHGVYRGQPTIDHGGAYGGYRTQLLRFPVQRFAVVTLCNSSTANPAQLSQSVASVYLGDRLAPVAPRVAGSGATGTGAGRLTREQLGRYAGVYWDAKNETMRRIEVRDSVLAMTGSPILLLPVSETTFRASTANLSEKFAVERDGSVVMEETLPAGDKATYRRMPAPKTDAGTLSAYVGDYVSDELDTTWRIEQRDSTLIVRRGAVPDLRLQPVFLDAFNSPGGVVRFVRAADGKVTGLVIGAGRVTGFVFRRVPRGSPGNNAIR